MAAPSISSLTLAGRAALPGLTAAALAYFILAPHLPRLTDGEANGFLSAAFGLLLAAALVVAALPLRERPRALGLLALVGAGAGCLLTAASASEAATPFKALFAAAAGFSLGRLIFSPVLVYALAVLVALVDVASVSAGPTRYLVDEQPDAVDYLTLYLPHWGDSGATQVGISDFLFLAVYLEATWRFGLRRRLTAAALAGSLVASLAIAVWLDIAVPALPLLSLALIAPNADIVYAGFRAVRRE